MGTVRVLLAQMPQILLEIFEHEILHQPDLELVQDPQPVAGNAAAQSVSPDVVIVGTPSPDDPRMPLSLLTNWPRARIMMVTPTEGEAALFELRLHITELGRVSPAELVRTIRIPMR
jgi:hypothetical protein